MSSTLNLWASVRTTAFFTKERPLDFSPLPGIYGDVGYSFLTKFGSYGKIVKV